MYEARTADNEPIDIDSLRYRDDARSLTLFCRGCSIELFPVAWDLVRKYKCVAHFRRKTEHDPDCNQTAYEDLINSGKSLQITSEASLPGPYPSKLRFPKEKRIVGSVESSVAEVIDSYRKDPSKEILKNDCTREGNTSTSLLQVCRFYTYFPRLRNLPFEAEGCEGKTFEGTIRLLPQIVQIRELRPHIYFGRLSFKDKLDRSAEHLSIKVMGQYVERNRDLYCLELRWATWSERQKSIFFSQIEQYRTTLAEEWRKANAQKPRLNVFFLGEQSADNLSVFRLTDPKKICFVPENYRLNAG